MSGDDVDHGFGLCAFCERFAIVRVNTRELCADCLPAEFAGRRRIVATFARDLVELLGPPGHNVTPSEASQGRAAPPLSFTRRRRT